VISSPLFRRFFIPSLLVVCGATGIMGFVAARLLRSTYLDTVRNDLRDDARLIAEIIRPDLAAARPEAVQARVPELARLTTCRVTVVDGRGRVIADSEADPAGVEMHDHRPEIVDAGHVGEGGGIRSSETVHRDLFYFALRIDVEAQVYFVRLAMPVDVLGERLRELYAGLAITAGLALLAAAIICYRVARRHAEPLVEITEFAAALAHGQFNRRIVREETGEIGTLSSALNSMASALGTYVTQTTKDKAELLTILASMSEGVIATDAQQKVVLVNDAAANLLGFTKDTAPGKHLWEVVLNDRILKSATEVLAAAGERRTFQLGPITGRYLEVTVCTYPQGDDAPRPEGLIVVTHDTTQSVRYQELRKEFVANVSHELRTPLTVIKGFIETLLDGAMQDPEKTARYLATIERHTNQLTNLVNDLLEISRLESQPDLPRRTNVDLGQTIRKAAELLLSSAQAKKQTLTVNLPPHLPTVIGNADYLERAVSNLVDNASKYTPEGGRIDVTASIDDTHVCVEVADDGIGIPAEDLPRIFERFYRVDRSRSRDMGGTGLGLSIVKHIAQSHGGTIDVCSAVAAGSTFRLRLPIPPA